MEMLKNIKMTEYTSLGIGGPADYIYKVNDLSELKNILSKLNTEREPWRVLGKGSNILVSDHGLRCAVIILQGRFCDITFNDNFVTACGGSLLSNVIKESISKGFKGLENLAGIPGTIAGAVIGNAGTNDLAIGDVIEEITCLSSDGNVSVMNKKDLRFAYRKSNLTDNMIITSVKLRLEHADKVSVQQRYDEQIKKRMASQPYNMKSAGCVFKNTDDGRSAGMLIDKAGAKGLSIGAVSVSGKHANFFVCSEGAKASDFLSLIDKVKKMVKETSGAELELEIKIWGEDNGK
ncbi:MAG: UDP-N-acetylmuramate dehydrogenase [Elusimicrobiota bacterium]